MPARPPTRPVARLAALALAAALPLGLASAALAPSAAATTVPVVGGDRLAESGVVVDLGTAVPAPSENEAVSYVVADLASGEVLAAKSAHQRLEPASTLKVLTALTLLPVLDKDEVVLGSDEAVLVEGSKVGIEGGLSYTIDLLFKAMLLQSGNDAAHALADANGGVERTVAEMNAVATSLQALDTTVVNPSGLDEPGQLTSAYDLALVARAALARQDFRDYLLTPNAVMPGRDGTSFQIQNENRLLASYDGAIGVKNGYTTLARHTFVGAAERDGRGYLVTVMRTEGRAEAVAAQLLDWAFAHADGVEPVGVLVEPVEQPTAGPVTEAPATVAPGAPPATAPQGAATAVAATTPTADDGGSPLGTVAVVGIGLLGAVVALRVRAVRLERARKARRLQQLRAQRASSAR